VAFAQSDEVNDRFEPMVDLTVERRVAIEVAKKWGLEFEAPIGMSSVSYVAPTTGGAALKVPWSHDDESLHEADAPRPCVSTCE